MAKKESPQEAENTSEPEQDSIAEQGSGFDPNDVSKDSRNMAVLCYLLAIFTTFVGPLIIWLIKKDEDSFVDDQGKEVLNFQITVILAMLAASLLSALCIGVPLLFAIPIADVILCVIGAVKASNGIAYRYPLCLRLLK